MFDSSKKRLRFRIVIPAYPPFNIYSCIANKTTALGPVCVASAVHKMQKWDVEVIDENNLGKFGPRGETTGAHHEFLQQQRPADAVGFYGGLTSTIPRLYEIAKFYKDAGVVTIAGGQHFAGENIAEALASGIDYVVIGEGEQTITELLAALEQGREPENVKGIAYLKDGRPFLTASRDPVTDFEKLPTPNFSLVRYARIKIFPVERIRGCGMNCEFCTVKGKPRAASPQRLLQQISYLVETHNARRFFIVDDLFGQHRDETIQFCEMLADYQQTIGRKLDTTVQIRLDKARDTELLAAMQRSGIQKVAIGFESPIEEELQAMNKHINSEQMLSLARVFHNFGFLVHGMFIFGYPMKQNIDFKMSVAERVRRYKDFIKKARIDTVQILLAVPLPGTELRRRLQNDNRIYPLEDVGWQYYDGTFPLYEPDPPLTSEELHHAARSIMGRFYQLKYMFLVAVNILSFPSLVFFLHNLRAGWKRWHRYWRNYLIRFGGWITLRRWTAEFKKNRFFEKMQSAREHLRQRQGITT